MNDFFAGIDAGSRFIKIALVDRERKPVAFAVRDQGVEQEQIVNRALDELLDTHGLASDNIVKTIATGYGRSRISMADTTITEITCQAAGVRHLAGDTTMIIDIGGQDSKVIHLHPDGRVRDFAMNDRCAAGSGRFLEMAAERLGIPLAGTPPDTATEPASISNTCAVFAETEITGLLAAGTPPLNIMAGIRQAIASRVAALAGAIPPASIITLTGGATIAGGMAEALAAAMQCPVKIAPQARFSCALGAAQIAASS